MANILQAAIWLQEGKAITRESLKRDGMYFVKAGTRVGIHFDGQVKYCYDCFSLEEISATDWCLYFEFEKED